MSRSLFEWLIKPSPGQLEVSLLAGVNMAVIAEFLPLTSRVLLESKQ